MSFETREKLSKSIKAYRIIQRLNQLVAGEIEMTGPAVSAALGMLRKIIPDLSSVDHTGKVTVDLSRLSSDELTSEYRATETQIRNITNSNGKGPDPAIVH